MKHRTPFLLWLLFQSCMQLYATDCTYQADSLYNQANSYLAELRQSTDPDQQKVLEAKALETYSASFTSLSDPICAAQLTSLKQADLSYKMAVKAINIGMPEEAIKLFLISLKIRKDSLEPGNFNIIKCYANLLKAHRQILNFQESDKYYNLGFEEIGQLNTAPEKNDKFFKAYFYQEAAQLFIDKGDPYGALKLNQIAWNLFIDIGQYKRQVITGNQMGVIYEKLKEPKKGIETLLQVQEISTEQAGSFWINKIYQNLGNMYFLEEDYEEAIKYYELGIESAQNDPLSAGGCHANLGLIYYTLKKFEKAIYHYSQATSIYQPVVNQGKGIFNLSINLVGIGDVYREKQKFDLALQHYQQSLHLLIKDFEESDYYVVPNHDDIEIIGSRELIIEAFTEKANALYKKYTKTHTSQDLQAASENFSIAIQIIDDLKRTYREDESKLFLMNKAYKTYEGAIKVAMQQGNNAYAFQLAEKAKAILLYAYLTDKEAKAIANIPEEALTIEQNLKREIAILEQKRENVGNDVDGSKNLLDELIDKKRELEDLIAEFGEKYPEYYRLKYDTDLVNVSEIQGRLPDSTLMIEYFAGEKSWFVFALSKDQIQVKEIQPMGAESKEFAQLLPQTEAWTTHIPTGQKELFDCLGHQLYEELIPELWKEGTWKYAIVIHDRETYYLPIDALLKEEPAADLPISLYPFLLHDMAISSDFSAKVWLKGTYRKNTKKWFQKSLLAFAPDFESVQPKDLSEAEKDLLNLDFFKGRIEPDSSVALSPLAASKDEIRSIQELLGGEIYPQTDRLSLLGRFIKEAPKYRFIHLGTHGIFNKYNSKYSYLAFQPVSDGIDNERLYLADLYNLNLHAELVVLSACETQAGELLPGEGIASLAQGFTYAGAKSIVATLWSVQNSSNSELMKRFYQYLIQGDNKALAMQKAKISMNEEGSRFGPPFYWAAPNVIGTTSPINPPSFWGQFSLLGFSLLLFLGMGFIFMQKKKKR